MSEETAAAFRIACAADLDVECGRTAEAASAVASTFIKSGTFNGGRRPLYVAQEWGKGFARCKMLLLNHIQPFLTLPPEQLAKLVEVAIDELARTRARMLEAVDKMPVAPGGIGQARAQFSNDADREEAAFRAKVTLMKNAPIAPPSVTNISTSGSFSPVNVGSGSVNQASNSVATYSDLAQVLDGLIAAIDAQRDGNMADLREIAVEAASEAKKSPPNKSKLKGLLSGASEAVQGFAALEPAWQEVVKLFHAIFGR